VSVVVDQGRAYFVTAADSGKAKRLTNNPEVMLAPCTVDGKVLGETVRGRARLLRGQERKPARRLLRPGGGLFGSYVMYRLRGKTMNLYEVVPAEPGGG
jgi:PPOX class probable F420-dependent enzyme